MSIILRPYQEELIQQVKQAFKEKKRGVLIQSVTGSGKTALAASLVHRAISRGNTVWFLVHRRELIKQSMKAFDKEGIPYGVIASGFSPNAREPVQIASIGTFVKRHHRYKPPRIVIFDECFPAGTLIDGKPIESLEIGDSVKSFNHQSNEIEFRPIARLFRSQPGALVTVTIDGRSITCTPGHPFYIEGIGYARAIDLKAGDYALQYVPSRSCDSNEGSEKQHLQNWTSLLFKRVFTKVCFNALFGNDDSDKYKTSANFLSQNDGQQPDEERTDSPKGQGRVKKNWSQTIRAGWERYRADRTTEKDARIDAVSNDGSCGPNSYKRRDKSFTAALQAGFSLSTIKAWNRVRWQQPRTIVAPRTGSKERGILGLARVDRVTVQEQTSDGTFGGLLPDGFVYNIEVEGNHNYFADGILVHNCHHWGSNSWRRLYNWFPAETKIVGLSATPARSDGQGMGEFCEVMLTGPQPKQLIADGYLSPFRLLQPEPIDMSGVHIRMGEYDKKERDAAASKPRVVGDMISHYKQYAEGGRNLIFATSIKTSLDYVRKFTEEGYPAIHLDGETDDYLRDKALEDFDAGKILIVSNVGLFSEGMDCPALDCVTLGCPTKSIIQYLQQVGRALRPIYAEGADLSTATSRCQAIEDSEKPHAIILDHAGNSHHFGQPDEDREWSLEGRALRKKTNTVLPPRICGKCFASNAPWRTACELCGTEFNRQGREIERVDGTLTDANKAAIERFQKIKQRKAQIERASTREELIQVARERGYRYPEKFADYNLHVRARRERVA